MSFYFDEEYNDENADNFDMDNPIDVEVDISTDLYFKIKEIYENVFVKYRASYLDVYNPNICHYLTFDIFLSWILNNNKSVFNKFLIRT